MLMEHTPLHPYRYRKVIVLSLLSGNKSTLKSHDHNFLEGVPIVRHPFSAAIFAMDHFCKVQFFSNSIKGCLFCWIHLSDPAVDFVFVIAIWIMNIP